MEISLRQSALFTLSDLIIFSISSKLKSSECSLDSVRNADLLKNTSISQMGALFGKEFVEYNCFCFYICYKSVIHQKKVKSIELYCIIKHFKNRS